MLTALVASALFAGLPLGVGAAVALAFPVALYSVTAYDSRALARNAAGGSLIVRAAGRVAVVAAIALVPFPAFDAPAAILLTAAMAVALVLEKWFMASRLAVRFRSGKNLIPVIARGSSRDLVSFIEMLKLDPSQPYEVLAAQVTSEDQGEAVKVDVRLPRSADLAAAAVRHGAEVVAFVGVQPDAALELRRTVWELEAQGVDAYMVPILAPLAAPCVDQIGNTGLPLLSFHGRDLGAEMGFSKVVLDKILSSLMILLLMPAMLAVGAIVKLSSPGPVLFRQTRVGRGGRHFTMLKFRTMYVDAELHRVELDALNQHQGGTLFKIQDDPRITKVGAFLRRYSLDELPQLVNVVRGEMSLVGPRPPLPDEVANYDRDAHRRFRVRPGLTGLWQVSGRSDLSPAESTRLDTHYVEHWSVGMDLQILVRTARAVLSGEGAY